MEGATGDDDEPTNEPTNEAPNDPNDDDSRCHECSQDGDEDENDEEEDDDDQEVLEVDEDEEQNDDDGTRRLCRLMSNTLFLGFEEHVKNVEKARERRREALAFKSLVEDDSALGDDGAATKSQDELDGLGVWMPGDKYQGDVNYRTLQKLLARVDARGYERCACFKTQTNPLRFNHSIRTPLHRSAQQLEFHVAFTKAAARVIYRADWETQKPMIMDKFGWTKVNSEVLISTPRRFGKTFRCIESNTLIFDLVDRNHPHIVVIIVRVRRNHVTVILRVRSIAIFVACLAMSFGTIVV